MTESVIESAKRRRAAAAARVQAIEVELENTRLELEKLDALIAAWPHLAETPILNRSTSGPRASKRSAPRNGAEYNSKKEEVAAATREILLNRNRALNRKELYDALVTERGLTIQGTNPESVLSTMLWRMNAKIFRIPEVGYWVADRPVPEQSYIFMSRSEQGQETRFAQSDAVSAQTNDTHR